MKKVTWKNIWFARLLLLLGMVAVTILDVNDLLPGLFFVMFVASFGR